MNKISGVYQIVNTVTNDRYVGSSRDVKKRWRDHKEPSKWNENPNSLLYLDMQKYGLDKFEFQILETVEPEYLKQTEQKFIDLFQPKYNSINARGLDVDRRKKYQKKYWQSDRGKEVHRKYEKSEKYKEVRRKSHKKYRSQLCEYNGETLTLNALYYRFKRAGIEHPTQEAKKYLTKE